ncbi:SurA N-terminal domain-containing protein [Arenicella xantha]|uniref:Periplasmic chaperone PpiD n=1 Tax=Arenicella xantha TaxID=644221 RepID=A0A395JPA0_9GAMM|nr:SurA N-terminal domain-containing protein [Arenicella xantha]RBP51398.1 peptidyl-prolyl cis-trans isomerase D [Arenicella xantha]
MLTEIRDRSSGWFAWIIAGIIIIPMAFFGVQQYADTQARPTVVEIDGTKITQEDFQNRLSRIQNQRLSQNPELANSGVLNSKEFKTSVLQSMINQELVAYVAEEYNYQVSEQQINKQIVENPLYQVDGKFDQSVFNAQMASYGRAGAQVYRADLKRNERLGQVVSGYQESALVLPSEVRSLLEIQAERRTFDLITVNQVDFLESVSVSEQDVQEYYQANIDRYQNPDRVSVSYIELDTQSVAEGIEVEEDVLLAAYEDYKAGFASNETRTTRHILLSTTGDEDEQEQLAKAESLVSELRAGADFAELAEANSQDPGSASNGGSLGDVERGEMVAEFDEALFALPVQEISDPVKSPFGYHIIQVEKVNATEPEPFAVMRFELLEEEQQQQAEERVVELAEQLRNLLFENADSLEVAAAAANLEVQSSAFFARDAGQGVAATDAVREAAFSEAVLDDGVNSELIETSSGVYVAVRKLDFSPAQAKPLDEVRAQIKSTLTTERAIAAAKDAGDELLSRAKSDWTALAKDEAVSIETHTISMLDTERKVAPDVMREVVKAQLGDESTKVFSFTGLNGDFNIVRLTQIAPGNLASVSDAVKDATRRLIEQRNGASLVETYIESLSDELALEINEDLL